MPSERAKRRDVYLAKTMQEFNTFAEQGVCMTGNAFASVLIIKGQEDFEEQELSALRASLEHLGYTPEAWATMLTTTKHGSEINPALLRQAITAFSPHTILIVNDAACVSFCNAYADDLAQLGSIEEQQLSPRLLVHVCGMRVVNLDNFLQALGDSHQKQMRWSAIKQVPPLGEPY